MILTISSGSFSTALTVSSSKEICKIFFGWKNAFVISLQHSVRPRSVKINAEINIVYDLRLKPLTTA